MEANLTAGALAMLGSALAHSVLTLLTKQAKDRLVFRALTQTFIALLILPWLVFQPIPSWEVWRFLLLGAVAIWAFNMLLIAAFERGDMNLAYPVMRGSAPALATLAAYLFLGEAVSLWQLLGLAIASSALAGFAWPEKDGTPKAQILLFALAAACMTASYTVIDAAGVRASGNVMVYTGWFFVLSGLTIGTTAIIRRSGRLWSMVRQESRPAATCMLFNLATYWLALYAYSIAPVAPMAAMRETGIVFGALLATLVLKEPFGLKRIALAVLLVAGLVVMQAL
ncbi:DMT family transporter [uncultured Maricaulis sp.]|uniref:DMT family transporter n=1 Tax=uncultured Maricaulis sp. TaxID=174710 RepID=UPI0030DD544F